MEYSVLLETRAHDDMLAIAAWIARDSRAEAERWMQRLWNGVESLRSFPERCPITREEGAPGTEIRHLIVGDYRILFTICGGDVRVLHVRHAAQRARESDA
jgi:plasmid stabilization system protein ParE